LLASSSVGQNDEWGCHDNKYVFWVWMKLPSRNGISNMSWYCPTWSDVMFWLFYLHENKRYEPCHSSHHLARLWVSQFPPPTPTMPAPQPSINLYPNSNNTNSQLTIMREGYPHKTAVFVYIGRLNEKPFPNRC
jgi:hypothetical protein